MQALATMARLEKTCQSFAYILLRLQRESSHFGRKRYLFAKVLSKIQMRWQKNSFKSAGFEDIGEFGENSEDAENSPKSLEKVKLND